MPLRKSNKSTVRRWLPVAGAVLAAGLLSAVSAQQFSPEEQAEIDADANSVTEFAPIGRGGGLVCDTGEPVEFYFSDFESDDGGWSSFGSASWEWGEVVSGVFDGCDTAGGPEPAGAFSGDNAWATNLDGCYPNAGDTLGLTQTFDFSTLDAPIQLNLQHWLHVFGSFDFAEVFVNGDQLFLEDGSTATPDYEELALDLSAYAGEASVTIDFEVFATTVVNRAGWYLDDVSILICGSPGGEIPETTAVPTLNVVMTVILGIGLLLAGWLVIRARS